jgi:hypothetical protein
LRFSRPKIRSSGKAASTFRRLQPFVDRCAGKPFGGDRFAGILALPHALNRHAPDLFQNLMIQLLAVSPHAKSVKVICGGKTNHLSPKLLTDEQLPCNVAKARYSVRYIRDKASIAASHQRAST